MVKIHPSWKAFADREYGKEYFNSLSEFVKRRYSDAPGHVFPPANQILRAFDECPLNEVKVVILGQDPYPTKGHANGLCFSVNAHVQPLARSLQNIFKEIKADIGTEIPVNGDLTRWAKQGVLLLNSILTVDEGQPLSHQGKGWENFTNAALEVVNHTQTGVVFILWGSKAQDKASFIDASKHFIIQSPHPSPLSASRGFFGSKPFSQANDFLITQGKAPIIW